MSLTSNLCALNNDRIKRKYYKKLEIHARFERPCYKLKNVTSKLKIIKSKLVNLKQI